VAKSELGFAHYEGRNYVALMRHMSLCLVAMNFVAEHTERLRQGNPEVTLEQVCRALRLLCRGWLQRHRGTSELGCLLHTLCYHQLRNRAARASKQRRPVLIRDRKKPRRPRRQHHSRSTARRT
jgi:hypothetical protein